MHAALRAPAPRRRRALWARRVDFEGADLIEAGGDGGRRRRRRRREPHGRVHGRRRRRRGVPGRAPQSVRRAPGRRRAGRVESRGLARGEPQSHQKQRAVGGPTRAHDAETASRERLDRRFVFTRLGRSSRPGRVARVRSEQSERRLTQGGFVDAARGLVVRETAERRPRRPRRADVVSRRERLGGARHYAPGTPRARRVTYHVTLVVRGGRPPHQFPGLVQTPAVAVELHSVRRLPPRLQVLLRERRAHAERRKRARARG
mmetsp:Transcript_7103/g.30262  ORF Transcript_7103/g.30262 Transcript_7103/m.30262 type:complete len:261 (+) Transcript_7103:374-1156(+)